MDDVLAAGGVLVVRDDRHERKAVLDPLVEMAFVILVEPPSDQRTVLAMDRLSEPLGPGLRLYTNHQAKTEPLGVADLHEHIRAQVASRVDHR
ncbi:hypothetical protein GCM10010532_022030 [Dactylosporangium siamense]|uniref:Uncharacterized protein n=1 Tax=Dactylosporangium siamense TaxID=685454 RepID=A0A919PFU8_9ACTN|nr:hypothetical protein [Dactylosporangium siamense]GIG43402.1 hypothetical protein Dsi01nite_014430 [Dactylosporangium siamense]